MHEKITVGIIGGTGQMGQWFKKFFEKNKYNILIASRKTKLKPEQCAAKCDVVIISVPIASTTKVIKEVAPYVRDSALLMDLTSLKKEQVKWPLLHIIWCHNFLSFGLYAK